MTIDQIIKQEAIAAKAQGNVIVMSAAKVLEMYDRIEALERENAELRKDAERYRAIRTGLEVDPDNSGIVVSLIDDFGGETLYEEAADAAIDEAMKS